MEGNPMQSGEAEQNGRVNVGAETLPPGLTHRKMARMQGFDTTPSAQATQQEVHDVYEHDEDSSLSNLKRALVTEAASRLAGPRSAWTVDIVNDTPNDYVDAIHFDHPSFGEYTGVSIEYVPTQAGYSVIRPTETDIFTDGEGLSLYAALTLAVHMANREHNRHSPSRREQAEQAVKATRQYTADGLRALPGAIRTTADAIRSAADKAEPALRKVADRIEP